MSHHNQPHPALSLSLAGIFRSGESTAVNAACINGTAEVEISSENSGAARRSNSDGVDEMLVDEEEESNVEDRTKRKKKKRKKYHRHTPDQIREMEALFKESPHPDEKQRQQLSKQLGLAPRQVKFWFQNRRTQIKAIQERHENSILKAEIDKLRDDNKFLRDTIAAANNAPGCPKCGGGDHPLSDDKHLRVENAKLKAEVENLRMLVEKHTPPGGTRTATTSSESSEHHQQNQERTTNNNTNNKAASTNTMSLDFYSRVFGLEKAKIHDVVNQAMEELQKMATARDPLWVRSVETCREMLNYDEYLKQFGGGGGSMAKAANVEASRDHGLVFVELQRLVNCFMDVNQWKEMFPCLIAKAATVDVICAGDGRTGNGAVQLMFAEVQMLTPMVPTREVYFVRYCKQLGAEEWGIVDVSIDEVEENIDVKCRKRPSGCIIHDQSNGHCKVVWVEHLECKKTGVSSMYRTVVNSGLAFGATRWLSALQLQCERLLFFMATNVPTKDSTGVATLAGRKSMLRLAERMTSSFCCAIGASSSHNWTKVTSKTGVEVRVSSRKNLNDTGEPFGVILCAVSSVWLPVSPPALFDFLRDEAHRNEWDIMSDGGPVKSLATLAKGQDKGNSVTLQMMKANESATWILQDSCTNAYESMIVYAPVDIPGMKTVVTGCDSSSIAILPSGFSILHDGLDSRTQVITSLDKEQGSSGGSLLTIAFQILTSSIPAAKLTLDSVESASAFISCTLRNIKRSLECDES